MPYSIASSSSSYQQVSEERVSDDSILSAMDTFVRSYEKMKDTVMVPSRLKDMAVTVQFHKGTTKLPSAARGKEQKLTLSNGKFETREVDMFNLFQTLQNVREELSTGVDAPKSAAVDRPSKMSRKRTAMLMQQRGSTNSSSGTSTPDSIVNARDNELNLAMSSASLQQMDGGPRRFGDDGDEEEKSTEQLAALFREHLQGLFTMLNQMSNVADVLTNSYTKAMQNE